LRFVDRNSRCCICRAFCPTVVVTRQQAAGQPQEVDAGSFPKPPLAAGGAGQVGMGLSYHNGMAAYFDDRGQYEKAAMRMCRLEAAARSLGARPSHKVIPILILIVIIALIGCGIGVLVAMHVSGDWLKGTPNQGFFSRRKKTRNTKIAFIGLGRFFLLPVKNFGLFELPHSSPAQITSHSKP
jgi:hypothetical protein